MNDYDKIRKVCKEADEDDMKTYYALRTFPLPIRKRLQQQIDSFPLDVPFEKIQERKDSDEDWRYYNMIRTLPLTLRRNLQCRVNSHPLDVPFEDKA